MTKKTKWAVGLILSAAAVYLLFRATKGTAGIRAPFYVGPAHTVYPQGRITMMFGDDPRIGQDGI